MTTTNHGQIANMDESGNVDVFYPKTFSKDIYVNSNKRTLENFLGNTSISGIGDGTVTGAASSMNTAATNNANAINGKAPTSHASAGTSYGIGDASNFGHVKLSDNYAGSAGAAANGIAASSQAVSSHWYHMGTFDTNGNGHGTGFQVYCKHHVKNDGRFYLGIESGHETRVDYAYAADYSGSAGNASSVSNAIYYGTRVIDTSSWGNASLELALEWGWGQTAVLGAYELNSVAGPDNSRIIPIPYAGTSRKVWWVHCVWSNGNLNVVTNAHIAVGYWYISK